MSTASWSPPENPDPSEILHSAVHDRRNGNYAQALAKFEWFHAHALIYERGLSGVRLSFALGYWMDLAKFYPPAREAFLRIRDETESAFREHPDDFDLFHDVSSMNRKLAEQNRTADLFEAVAAENPTAASKLYYVAEDDLIATGRYCSCGPFLEPARRTEFAKKAYHQNKRHEESRPDSDIPIPKVARKMYLEDVAGLVALLVHNDRTDEAQSAAEQALLLSDDDEFREVMGAGADGTVSIEIVAETAMQKRLLRTAEYLLLFASFVLLMIALDSRLGPSTIPLLVAAGICFASSIVLGLIGLRRRVRKTSRDD